MMKYLSILTSFFLMWSCSSSIVSQQATDKAFQYETHIDGLADTFLMDPMMHSLSIGIYHNGESFSKHYGELDPGKANKPNDKTIYDIASVTKTFVGTLMAQAVLDGKLTLEDELSTYLDGAYPNLSYKNEPIRIKHLVTHTSGLPKFLPLGILDELNKGVFDEGLANRLSIIENDYSKNQFFEDLKEVTIDTVPGYKYDYCNVGAELACHVLERVYNIPIEQLLRQKIWNKASMASTMIHVQESDKQFYANGYGEYKNRTPPMKSSLWGGSGHGKSTMSDMINYIKFHLDEENQMVQESHKPLFDQDLIDGDPRIKIGYLWQVSTDRDFGQVLKHHGGAFGTQNWIFVYPEANLGISIITNQSGMQTAGKLMNVTDGILSTMAKNIK